MHRSTDASILKASASSALVPDQPWPILQSFFGNVQETSMTHRSELMRSEKDEPARDACDSLIVGFQDLQHADQKRQKEMKDLLAPEAKRCYCAKNTAGIKKAAKVFTIG